MNGDGSTQRRFAALGAVSGFIAVLAGAFGAHALKARIAPELLAAFETGARYQMYHALGLLAVAWAGERWPGRWLAAAGWLFVTGTGIFSGSLYALALTGASWWGAITPVGGMALLAGWLCFAWGVGRSEARSA